MTDQLSFEDLSGKLNDSNMITPNIRIAEAANSKFSLSEAQVAVLLPYYRAHNLAN